MNKNVLRTVIAMNQRDARRQSVRDQFIEKVGGSGISSGGEAIVRLQPQRFKKCPVVKHRRDFILKFARPPMNRAEQLTELDDIIPFQLARQQPCLPILVWTRHRLHGQQMMSAIFKYQWRDRTWRRKAGQPDQ